MANQWIVGPAGSGKTRHVQWNFPDAHHVRADDVFWMADAARIETVLFDDLRPGDKDSRIALLKALARGDPVDVPVKHRDRVVLGPVQVVVTSCHSIYEVFPEDWRDLAPLFEIVQLE